MVDVHHATLEQRLTTLEAELNQAKERVRAFEDWRRRATRVCFLVMGCAAALLVVISRTAPAISSTMPVTIQPHMTVQEPFTVVNSSGRKLFEVVQNEGGGAAYFYNYSGAKVVSIGSTKGGDGGSLYVASADQKSNELLTANSKGPAIYIDHGGMDIAYLGINTAGNPLLDLYNKKGPAVTLEVSSIDSGRLVLTDAANIIRVEAGVDEDGSAVVTVAGPKGKCVAIGPIACMLLSH